VTDGGHGVEVEEGIAVGLGALELEREAAIGGELRREEDFLEALAAEGEDFSSLVKEAKAAACMTQQVP